MLQRVDVKLIKDEEGITDIGLDTNGDLLTDSGLETTLRILIYGQRRATDGEVLLPENRSGWIGNLYADTPGFEAGSKLWLLRQARLTDETINNARYYLEDALKILITDGFAKDIEVSTNGDNNTLNAIIIIDGEPFYFDLWEQTTF